MAFLQATRPALVLLDMQMPPVNGVELCRLVRAAAEPLRSQPVALFTHWGVPGDVVAGLEAGADYVVSKDLLSDPVRWQRRVSEGLLHAGRPPQAVSAINSRGPVDTPLPPPKNWMDVLNLGLYRVLVRRVGLDVTRLIVRRALRQVAAAPPEAFHGPDGTAAEAMPFPPDWNALIRPPGMVFLLAAALADQMDRLVGSEESTTIRAALAPLLDGPEDLRTLR